MRRFLTALPPKGDAPEAPPSARAAPSPVKPNTTPPAAPAPSPKPAAAAPAPVDPAPKPKKPRTSNPGVRQVGGRIYDSETGTTCHQCRQKTVEVKAKCRACPLYFCSRCIRNRYNEQVEEVNALPAWACPRCRKLCNCSNCRKKAGLAATGILATVAKAAGLGSVSELLAKNPDAQAAHMKEQAARAPKAPKPPKEHKAPKAPKRKAAAPEALLVDDAALPPRPTPMPAGEALALYSPRAADAEVVAAKRPRGAPLPEDVDAGELACVLEFVSAFATTPALGFESPLDLSALGAELTRPAAAAAPLPTKSSLAAVLQAKLLGVVRGAWGAGGPAPPEPISLDDWEGLMRGYYAEAVVLSAEDTALLRAEHGPLAAYYDGMSGGDGTAAAAAASPSASSDATAAGSDSGSPGSDTAKATNASSKRAARRNSASPEYLAATTAAAAVAFPEGGYWAVTPGTRVKMACALLHDALDTFTLREAIDKAMEAAADADKERRAELAAVQRAAKEAAARQRDQEIAAMVADNGGKGMTLEEQKVVVEEARCKAEEAAAAAAAAKVKALSRVVLPPCVRTAPLGADRDGAAVWKLAAAEALTGAPAGLVVAAEDFEGTLRAVVDGGDVAAALDPRGRREGPLRHAIASACGFALTEPEGLPPLPQAQPKSPKPAVLTSPAAVAATVEGSEQGGATAIAAS